MDYEILLTLNIPDDVVLEGELDLLEACFSELLKESITMDEVTDNIKRILIEE